MLSEPQRILNNAIETWQPAALVALYSGGYDSAVTTHVLHRLDTRGLPIQVWSIDTKLAADGWKDYIKAVANDQGWDHRIYDNKKGFEQFVQMVRDAGCPRSRAIHTHVFQKLKERGFDAIHMMNKVNVHSKTLFISGIRQAESTYRKEAAEVQRIGISNKIFAAPIIHWSNAECDYYRIENGLPDNPFYETVKGSGDCQCNWANFITMRTLKKHSPNLATGNVGLIDKISREEHGYGWDGAVVNQTTMFADIEGEANLSSPFLCEGCSRRKVRPPTRIVESRLLQQGLF